MVSKTKVLLIVYVICASALSVAVLAQAPVQDSQALIEKPRGEFWIKPVYGDGEVSLYVNVKNFQEPIDAFGFRVHVDQPGMTYVDTKFSDAVSSWVMTGSNVKDNVLIVGGFDVEKSLAPGTESNIAVIRFKFDGKKAVTDYLQPRQFFGLVDDLAKFKVRIAQN